MRHSKIVLLLIIITSLYSLSSAQLPTLIGTVRADTAHTLFGYRIVPLGDQNDDGYDDFIAWGYDYNAYLFFGGLILDTLTNYDLKLENVRSRFNSVGDLNSDGFDDIVIGGQSEVNWQMQLFYGGNLIDTVRDLWFGNDTLKGDGFNVYTSDINENGTKELLSAYTNLSIFKKFIVFYELGIDSDSIADYVLSPPNMDLFVDYDGFGDALIKGDFNGDLKDDVITNLRFNESDSLNGQLYLYFGGSSFDTIPEMIITRPDLYRRGFEWFGFLLESLGDVNDDGYDDFLAGSGVSFEDTVQFIYFGGPSLDTIPDITLYERISRARLAGDLNGDGVNDIITSYPLPSSGTGHVNIYYGGVNIDNIPDITITNGDIPNYQEQFGNDCSGLGDVNGDGINDFGFSAIQGQLKGIIYIYSGTGPSTDIEYEYEPNLPDKFTLSQNYPNPFNPSTTIEFQIPQKEYVTLAIYNTLGQKIRTLINKELSVGSYSLEWDSTNEDGKKVSSGVYLYKLETAESTLSKKMLLLK